VLFGGRHIVLDPENLPVAANTLEDAAYLGGTTGQDRPTAGDVLHLSQAHRTKAAKLVEDLRISLQSLTDDHLARLSLDELTQADSHLLEGVLEPAAVLDYDPDRIGQFVVVELSLPIRRTPPVAQQPSRFINLSSRRSHEGAIIAAATASYIANPGRSRREVQLTLILAGP
jgi:hypothetical protein